MRVEYKDNVPLANAAYNYLVKFKEESIESLGRIGILKHKKLIFDTMARTLNNIEPYSAYDRLQRLCFSTAIKTPTDTFTRIVNRVFDAIEYDVKHNVLLSKENVVMLTESYFLGAMTEACIHMSGLITLQTDERNRLNTGYMESVVQKSHAQQLSKVVIKADQVQEFSLAASKGADEAFANVSKKLQATLSSIPQHENTLEAGEWVSVGKSKEIVSVSRDGERIICELADSITNPVSEIGISYNKEIDDFKESNVQDYIDLDQDRENRDSDIRTAVSDAEKAAEQKAMRDIKSRKSTDVDIRRERAVWHARKAAGDIPKDEEMPEHLVEKRSEVNPAMAQALKQALTARKQAKESKGPDPLSLNSGPQESAAPEEVPAFDLGDGSQLTAVSNVFLPEDTLEIAPIENDVFDLSTKLSEEAIELPAKETVIETPKEETTMTKLQIKSLGQDDMHWMNNTFVMKATKQIETKDLIFIQAKADETTGNYYQMNAALELSAADYQADCADIAKKYAMNNAIHPVYHSDVDTIFGNEGIYCSAKNVIQCSFNGLQCYYPNGMPVIWDTDKNTFHEYSVFDLIVNGIIPDSVTKTHADDFTLAGNWKEFTMARVDYVSPEIQVELYDTAFMDKRPCTPKYLSVVKFAQVG